MLGLKGAGEEPLCDTMLGSLGWDSGKGSQGQELAKSVHCLPLRHKL